MYSRPVQSRVDDAVDGVEGSLGARGLRCIQPAGERDDTGPLAFNGEHPGPPAACGPPEAGLSAAFLRNRIRLLRSASEYSVFEGIEHASNEV